MTISLSHLRGSKVQGSVILLLALVTGGYPHSSVEHRLLRYLSVHLNKYFCYLFVNLHQEVPGGDSSPALSCIVYGIEKAIPNAFSNSAA